MRVGRSNSERVRDALRGANCLELSADPFLIHSEGRALSRLRLVSLGWSRDYSDGAIMGGVE
jgi:hypothetical protein